MRASSANRTACTGTGKVIIASMLCSSSFRNWRFMVTLARPPAISTSKLVNFSGTGRRVSPANAPVGYAANGSIEVCGAIFGMGWILEKIVEELSDALHDRLDQRAGSEML